MRGIAHVPSMLHSPGAQHADKGFLIFMIEGSRRFFWTASLRWQRRSARRSAPGASSGASTTGALGLKTLPRLKLLKNPKNPQCPQVLGSCRPRWALLDCCNQQCSRPLRRECSDACCEGSSACCPLRMAISKG